MLRQWIADSGTTQMKLAAELGVSQTAVSAWLSGSEPRATIAGRLQELAGIPLSAWGEKLAADADGSGSMPAQHDSTAETDDVKPTGTS